MQLSPGLRLAHYEITSAIGKGGMGEVWRAKDTKLGREVAIKVLPDEFTSDRERLTRFEREARILASLDHPNVASIYEIGTCTVARAQSGSRDASGAGSPASAEHDDVVHYLAMQLAEGEDLSQRLDRGAIPVDEALSIAKQIGEALEAAHEKGIVHRDLKPANVKLGSEGHVRVLDFGLARAIEGDESPDDFSKSPTMMRAATHAGVILGTAAYMSPEQARGKRVDKRADIWAFGVVLFEMLTGRRLFAGETVSDTLAEVLKSEIDFKLLPPGTPAMVRRVLQQCLERNPKNRLHDIADARIVIDAVMSGAAEATNVPASPSGSASLGTRAAVALALTGLAFGALLALGLARLLGQRGDEASGVAVRASISLPDAAELVMEDRAVALSPDGTQLALVIRPDPSKSQRLFVRRLGQLEFREVAGTDDATYPFWSPDGTSIAFFAEGKLKRADVAQGVVRVLCDAPAGRGGAWSTEGFIVFAPAAVGGLSKVAESGGTPVAFSKPSSPSESQRNPHFLPGGRRIVLFSSGGATNRKGVFAYDPETEASKFLVASDAEGFYVEPGYLVFSRDENLLAQPFDAKRMELMGEARPIASGVHHNYNRYFMNLDVTGAGPLVYQELLGARRSRLAWLDRRGAETPIAIEPMSVVQGDVTDDGRRLVAQSLGSFYESHNVIVDLERGVRTPLGDPRQVSYNPRWAANGTLVAFELEDANAQIQLALSEPRPGAVPKLLTSGGGREYANGGLTPDGRLLLYREWKNSDKLGDLMVHEVAGNAPARPVAVTSESEDRPVLNPAGDVALAVVGGREAEWGAGGQLKVVLFPDGGDSVQITSGGVQPHYGWLGDREIYWSDTNWRSWAATIGVRDGRIDVGPARPLFDGRPLPEGMAILDYAIAKKSFLVAIDVDAGRRAKLVVASNWRDGLK